MNAERKLTRVKTGEQWTVANSASRKGKKKEKRHSARSLFTTEWLDVVHHVQPTLAIQEGILRRQKNSTGIVVTAVSA